MKHGRRVSFGIIALALLALPPGRASADPIYAFEVVARTGDVVGGQVVTNLGPASFNSSGTAVFVALFQGGGSAIVLAEGSSRTILASAGSTIGGVTLDQFSLTSAPQINDAGTVAFSASIAGGGRGVFTPDAVLAKTGDVISGLTVNMTERPELSMNNAGTVVFQAGYDSGTRKAIFQVDGTTHTPTVVAGVNGNFAGYELNNPLVGPSINDSGVVTFQSTVAIGGSAVFSLDGSTESLLVKTGTTVAGQNLTTILAGHGLNNLGTLAFSGSFDNGADEGSGIFLDGAVDSILLRDGQLAGSAEMTTFRTPIGINDLGTVAFSGLRVGSGALGLYTQYGLVIEPGMMLAGLPFNAFDTFPPKFSLFAGSDRIAFGGSIIDREADMGYDVVVLATPNLNGNGTAVAPFTAPPPSTSVPEPASMTLLVAGLAACLAGKRWRRKMPQLCND